ncbi:MAG: 4-hydroxythreonine-4-phosphate dehydrogenase PdxA [Elusimicrobiota bacterium]
MIKPTVAITLGDPTGIGPEIVKKAVSDKSVLKICNPVVVGTSRVGSPATADSQPVAKENFTSGKPSQKSDKASISFLIRALKLVKNKKVDAIVTAPVSKSAFTCPTNPVGRVCLTGLCRRGGIGGHTEFFAKNFNVKNVEMLMVADDKKALLLTRHIPLKDVSKKISIKKIVKSTLFVCDFLKKKYDIKKPKIIVCGLNPHCGDNGLVGAEEKEKIIPAIKILIKKGFDVSGPVNSEVAFKKKSDLIVCMYHDQAMLPLKLLNPNKIVNVTIGLPFIRTSPGHGTAYNIAGKNKANPRPMIEAIKLAALLTKSKK